MCNLLWSNSSSCSMQAAQFSDDGDLDACAEAGWTTSPKSIPSSERINSRFFVHEQLKSIGMMGCIWDEYGMNGGLIWLIYGLIYGLMMFGMVEWWLFKPSTIQPQFHPQALDQQRKQFEIEAQRALAESPETIWGIPAFEIQQIMELGFTGTPLVWLIGYV